MTTKHIVRDGMSMKGCLLIIQEQKCQELCQAIEPMSERQESLAAQMEMMRMLQRGAPEEFLKQLCQEIKEQEEQRFKEELDLSETKELLEQKTQVGKIDEKKGTCQSGRGERSLW